MPLRRTPVEAEATIDPTGIDLGPPPGAQAAPDRMRRQATGTTGSAPISRSRINGLAGLCMLVLVVSGLGLPLPGGHLAADAILVIVGFQLGLGVTRLAGSSSSWLRRFWLSAIGPVAVPTVVAVGLAVAYWWWLDRLGPAEVRGALASLAMITNLTPLLSETSFAATDHLWLISLIVQFAVLAPLAALVIRRQEGPRTIRRTVITLVAAVMVVRLTMALTGLVEPSTLAQLTLTRVDGLLLGLGVAVAPRSLIERIPAPAAPVALLTLLAIFASSPDPSRNPVIALGLLTPLVVGATAIIVAGCNPSRTDALSRFLGGLGPRWLGERAISIYIWHQLFGMGLTDEVGVDIFGQEWPGLGLFVTRLVFALAAGAASYRYLQLPLRSGVERVLGRRRSGAGPRMGTSGPPALSTG